jgi:membrane-associated protein
VTLPTNLGYVGLALLVGGESLGLLVPGETAILAAAVLAREGSLDIVLVVAIAATAAVIGDNVGYLLSRRGARILLLHRGPLLDRRMRTLARGERFFARYGRQSVFIGRWVVFGRVTVPWLAGASRMPWRPFLFWNVLGGVSWATTVAVAGYALGAAAEVLFTSTTVAVLAVLVFLAVRAWWRGRHSRDEAARR